MEQAQLGGECREQVLHRVEAANGNLVCAVQQAGSTRYMVGCAQPSKRTNVLDAAVGFLSCARQHLWGKPTCRVNTATAQSTALYNHSVQEKRKAYDTHTHI